MYFFIISTKSFAKELNLGMHKIIFPNKFNVINWNDTSFGSSFCQEFSTCFGLIDNKVLEIVNQVEAGKNFEEIKAIKPIITKYNKMLDSFSDSKVKSLFKTTKNILKKIKSVVKLPKNAHVEGGDVVLDDGHIFIGYYGQKDYKNQITARTNKKAIKLIRKHFPNKKTVPLEIIKSPHLPTSNALHLDCCFQPLSNNKAVICKKAFKNPIELNYLISLYGNENIFEITLKEMSKLYSNFLSIDKK